MAVTPTSDQMVGILRETVVSLVRRDGPDLSARQLGVFLTCYLRDGGHTVRGLAADLNVSKPAITRALDRLGELDLARRKVDPLDRRSILVQRTVDSTAARVESFFWPASWYRAMRARAVSWAWAAAGRMRAVAATTNVINRMRELTYPRKVRQQRPAHGHPLRSVAG